MAGSDDKGCPPHVRGIGKKSGPTAQNNAVHPATLLTNENRPLAI